MDDGNRNIRSSDPVPSAINVEPCAEAEAVATRIDLIPEHEYDKDTGVARDNNDSIDRNDNKLCTEINEKGACPSPKCVASVASVANNDVALGGLPEIPCAWCDYKNAIEFDLGNHLLANHRGELMKLPMGKGAMDDRIDYAIQQTKMMIAAQYEDEDTESNDDE